MLMNSKLNLHSFVLGIRTLQDRKQQQLTLYGQNKILFSSNKAGNKGFNTGAFGCKHCI